MLDTKIWEWNIDDNAYKCTKAYFFPLLEGKKNREVLHSQVLHITSHRIDQRGHPWQLVKLLDRAVEANIDEDQILMVFNCIAQLTRQELEFNARNIHTLRFIIGKDYQNESKILKEGIVITLAWALRSRANKNPTIKYAYHPRLIYLIPKCLDLLKQVEDHRLKPFVPDSASFFSMVIEALTQK